MRSEPSHDPQERFDAQPYDQHEMMLADRRERFGNAPTALTPADESAIEAWVKATLDREAAFDALVEQEFASYVLNNGNPEPHQFVRVYQRCQRIVRERLKKEHEASFPF